jgi:hypothetical protein
MPIFRSTIVSTAFGVQTWKATWVASRWAVRCVYCSEEVATSSEQYTHLTIQCYTTQTAFQFWTPKTELTTVLLTKGIMVPETCWVNKSPCFVATSWSLFYIISTMHGHTDIKFTFYIYPYLAGYINTTFVKILQFMWCFCLLFNDAFRNSYCAWSNAKCDGRLKNRKCWCKVAVLTRL